MHVLVLTIVWKSCSFATNLSLPLTDTWQNMYLNKDLFSQWSSCMYRILIGTALHKCKWIHFINLMMISFRYLLVCRCNTLHVCICSCSSRHSDKEIPHLPSEEWPYQHVCFDNIQYGVRGQCYSRSCHWVQAVEEHLSRVQDIVGLTCLHA